MYKQIFDNLKANSVAGWETIHHGNGVYLWPKDLCRFDGLPRDSILHDWEILFEVYLRTYDMKVTARARVNGLNFKCFQQASIAAGCTRPQGKKDSAETVGVALWDKLELGKNPDAVANKIRNFLAKPPDSFLKYLRELTKCCPPPTKPGKPIASIAKLPSILTTKKSAAPLKKRVLSPLQKSSCCQVPPGPPTGFHDSLKHDAGNFSKYVGGGWPLNGLAYSQYLTSGLHLEMKLWDATPFKWRINDAERNAWSVMRVTLGRNTFTDDEKAKIYNDLCHLTPEEKPASCVLEHYDKWLLNKIDSLRAQGVQPARTPVLAGSNQQVSTLASHGRAQKLINIYVKYEHCWQVAGQWISGHLRPYAKHKIPSLPQFLCALHAPIDSILLKGMHCYPLGKYLKRLGMLRGEKLVQADGAERPWSKLDCLRTYYGFQLIYRRVAMRTWPVGCGCSDSQNLTNHCADMFEKEFASGEECQGPDWIQVACELPDEIIDETLKQLEENERIEKIVKDGIPNQEDQQSARNILGI